jgi:hypothetical protein
MSTTAPAYVVTNDARGTVRYATADRAAALAWAQDAADADAVARPNDATPHYVVTEHTGEPGEAWHVYARRNGQVHPMTNLPAEPDALVDLDEPCGVEGCAALAAGRWDVGSRAYVVAGVPLCAEHEREHRADAAVTVMRAAVAR